MPPRGVLATINRTALTTVELRILASLQRR
jgi:hypothetical protein